MSFISMVWSKITWPYLASFVLLWLTAAVSVLVTYRASGLPRSWRGLLAHALPPGTLAHPSARADVVFWVTRKLFGLVMVVPAVVSAATVGALVHAGLARLLPDFAQPAAPAGPVVLIVFSASMFLAYDLAYYLYHALQHRIPVLWELHKVHHSAEVMVGFTKDRVHPLDDAMNLAWNALITGPLYGAWMFFLLDPVEVTVFGLNIYVLRGILMLDMVRHTHLPVSFGRRVNGVILCPHWHQLHHSADPRHYDRNFGLMLSVWDRMFGTAMAPAPGERFRFGLSDGEHAEYRSATRLWIWPAVKIARLLRRPKLAAREG